MDISIRQLLAASGASGTPEHSKNLLLQAYKLLDAASKESSHIEGASPCGSDLYVITAELAIKLQESKVAEGALQMYFQGTQLTDQFLCRAYICKAQLLSSKSTNSAADLDSAVVFLLKAINFAKDKPRYHFIVYNVSVLFWQMARSFLRPGLRGLLHQSLQQIVKALSDIDDQDYDWRATLMVALVESLIDAGKTKEAVAASEIASDFTLKYAKLRFKDVFRLQIQHKLVEKNKLSKTVINIPEFSAFVKLQKLKRSLSNSQDGDSKLDVSKELKTLINLIAPQGPKSLSSPVGRKKSALTVDSESQSRVSSISPPRQRSRIMSKSNLEIPGDLMNEIGKDFVPSLLLETARFCADCEEVKLARHCLTTLEGAEDRDTGLDLEAECLKCVLLVKDLGDMEEIYTQPSVDVRLFAIKRMDQNIQNATRSGNARVVQAACVTQWNLCLPLLQPNLRKSVRRPLTLVAQSLEDIQSLEIQLRCQLHAELAKCEQDVEQVEAALRHIRKALQLDQSGFYHQRLHTMLRRLELSTQLYQSPETPEDTAAVIIEQARKSSDSGSVRMKRSLLVKAGLALAPDAFQYVLDSEGEVKVTGQKTLSPVELLEATAAQWKKCVRKAEGHLKRLGDENDRERARLWADLAKVARGQEVWDVCRVAARFCLLYDDGRWEVSETATGQKQVRQPSAPTSAEAPKSQELGSESIAPLQNQVGITSSSDLTDSTRLHDTDLLRLLAEVHFIHGEAHIHLLQCQGLKLNQAPRFPADTHHRPKSNPSSRNSEAGLSWMTYTEWIKQLSRSATTAFLRAIELGVKLQESWIVCSGTAYLWNYHKHLLDEGQLSELIEVFKTALNGLRNVGHSSEIVLLVRVCNLIAQGLLRPWVASKPPSDTSADPTPDIGSSKPPSRKKTPGKEKQAGGTGGPGNVVDPDAHDDLKKALEITEYALEVTRGNIKRDIIPTAVRHEIISTWVLLKQMLQQQIGAGLGVENETILDQKEMTKSLVMLEIHTLNRNGMMEFTVPTLEETADVTESCEWNDTSIELEVWSRLAFLAHKNKEHSLVVRCANKAIAFEAAIMKKSRKGKKTGTSTIEDYEMLSYASCILGESIMTTVSNNPYARRQAVDSFVTSARFANAADNYNLVMSACTWWWNACLPLMSSAIERELLRQPLTDLMRYVTSTANRLKLHIEQREKEEATSKAIQTIPMEKAPAEQDDHNFLRAAMYGVLFQTYTDKGQWEDALTCMDRAIQHMPRTKHRLPIFKHRIMVKAKLGRSVYADIAKFREESEEYVAHMWHRVALSSHEQLQQLSSYQKAIESLHSEENVWVKVDYLVELSTWLYCNEYPVSDAVNVMEWAVDILFSMKFEELQKEESKSASKGKRKTASRPARTPASKGIQKSKEAKRTVKIEEKTTPKSSEKPNGAGEKGDENPEDVLPVDKEIIIGLREGNLDLKLSSLNSVRQLEGLVRTHVMLSTISGRGSEDHKSYILMAVGYVMRLWEIAFKAAVPLIGHLPAGNTPVGKDKVQKKGAQEVLPQDVMQWASYDVPEDILRAFSFNMHDTAVSDKTITKPALTVHYLEELASELSFYGYTHLSLPVLCLTDVIVSGIVKSQSWSDLITIKKVKVCYDLGLDDIAKRWEEKVGDLMLSENERASFVQEHAMMMQHEKQVKHEEARTKGTSQAIGTHDKDSQASDKTSLPITLQGRQIKGLCVRRLWMEKAKLLLDLGHRQRARELLNQAMESAFAFKDENLLGDLYLAMSRLAVMESNLGQAMKFLTLAQDIGGDEQYWYEVTILLIDAIILDPDVTTKRLKQTYALVRTAIQTMEILKGTRPTKQNTTSRIIATIKSRSALLQIERLLSEKDGIERSVDSNLLILDDAENTLKLLGFTQDAAKLYRKHAQICLKLFERTDMVEEKHSFLLIGLEKLEFAMEILTNLYGEVIASMNLKDGQTVTLPLVRDFCDTALDMAQYLLRVSDSNTKEQKLSKQFQAKSGSLRHIVNDFIGTQEDLTQMETEWRDLCTLVPQKMFSTLICAYNLSKSLPENRARCLYLIGSSMQHLSLYYSENVSSKWSVDFLNITTEVKVAAVETTLQLEDVDQIDERTEHIRIRSAKSKSSMDSTLTNIQKKKLIENAANIIKREKKSVKFCTQATEILMQSVKLALQLKLLPVVRDASLEIVEACGQLDPATASLYLALHQSSKISMDFNDFLLKTQPDPATSQFSALLHQANWLLKENPQLKSSSIYEWVNASLQNFTAWKRLTVDQNALDLLKDFPPNFNFIILQHSPDRKHLYAALLDKPKSAALGKLKDKQEKSGQDSKSHVIRVDVSSDALDDLHERMEDYGLHLMSLLLQSEYQRAQLALRQKMLQDLSLGNDNVGVTQSKSVLDGQEEDEMKIIDDFQDIVDSLESYLAPVVAIIKDKYTNPLVKECKANIEAGQSSDINAMETVVLLVDQDLIGLPLEALTCFQTPFIDCLCRDYSLQMSHHRWHVDPEEAARLAEKKKNEPPSKANPKTPKTGKDTRKTPGTSKVVPLNRDVLPGCESISTNSVHYMVDPLDETAETEEYKPMKIFDQVRQTYSTTCTALWNGWTGSSGVPSIGQWENMISGCEAFIFYGMERFYAHLPPSKVAPLDLSACQMVLLLDKAQTNKSFRHQSKVDVDKSESLLAMEKPLHTIAMLSLAGVNCVCSNLWHSTLEDNANKLQCISRVLLEDGQVVGKAVRGLLNPTLKKPEPPVQLQPSSITPAAKDKGGKSKGKMTSKKGEESPSASPVLLTPEPEASEQQHPQEEEKVDEIPVDEPVQASWCNMVLFGLPNLMVV